MFRATAVLAVLPLLVACRTEPRETGCTDCFEPVQMLWNLSVGIRGDGFADVSTLEGVRSPLLQLVLVDEEYAGAQDEAHACVMEYRIEGAPGTLEPNAWQDWALVLTPFVTDCQDLASAQWGDAPLERFADRDWEIVMEDRSDATEQYLEGLFASQGTSWALDGAPYYFGSHTWIDAYDTSGDLGQTHYARAWQVDADMAIVDETEGGHLLPVEDVAAGSDGYYEVFSIYYFLI